MRHWESGAGHVGAVEHDPPPPQLVSHLHDCAHSIAPLQLDVPPHETVHEPVPHAVAPAQLDVPPHEI